MTMEKQLSTKEKLEQFRLEMKDDIESYLIANPEDFQEISDRSALSVQDIEKTIDDATFIDIIQLSKLYTAVKEKKEAKQNENPSLDLEEDEPAFEDPRKMLESLQGHLQRNYSAIFDIAEYSGLPTERIATIISGSKCTMSELNRAYCAVQNILEASNELLSNKVMK